MKKFILLSTLLFSFGSFVKSQSSFTLIEPSSTTITEPVSNYAMDEFLVGVQNTSSSDKYVKVKRNIINEVSGGSFYYCWDLCYSAGSVQTYPVSPGNVLITAGGFTTLFSHHYNSLGNEGTNTIEYCFFDQNNTTDMTCITLNHVGTTGSTSIIEVSGNSNFLSSPQPNPANTTTSIVYNLTSLNNGKIVLRNMLGSVIKEIQLDKASDSKAVDVSALNAGIYFYSLVNNGSIVSSQRLVVK